MQSDIQRGNGNSDSHTIRADLTSLKDDAATLVRDVKDRSEAMTSESLNQLYTAGRREFSAMEEHVKEKPGQSVLLAFAAGLIASYILGARR